ncbi:putative peroxisomal-coenzyme A synthetase [Smittium culicis]|uniref:Putative peroxisomal-coenzyme A synthetase n=1 Tax=Smittium culicis TaxID=133412 RepID=A0A1R1YJV8_9FUNG|nr:putative peroxisomal-coenzyme A synthetase [Smittium culicis]OMJ27164.1 putative peroxisomal-coenzyme A synthetase [Smittium culicis]
MFCATTFATIFNSAPDSTAVLTTSGSDVPNSKLSYSDLNLQVRTFISQATALFNANNIDPSSNPGLPIAHMLDNGLLNLITFLGTSLMRSISAPLNPAMKQSEIEFYLEDSSSKVLIVSDSYKESPTSHNGINAAIKLGVSVWFISWAPDLGVKLEKLGSQSNTSLDFDPSSVNFDSVAETDVALLLHTSGTTGRPKAVPLSHRNILNSMRNISSTYNLSTSDRSFIVMPLFHVHGLIGAVMSSLYSGGSVAIPPKYSATSFWPDFISTNSNWYSAVPTIHQIQLQKPLPENLPSIRFIRSCSASLAPVILARLEEKFKAPVLEAYAMTEASHQMTSNPIPPKKHVPGSVGIAQGVQVAILDESGNHTHIGEVCIRGNNVTSGYLNNPEANASNFTASLPASEVDAALDNQLWFRTGDQGYLDSEGYLFLTGRIKELINRGGEKISPLEIDSILLDIPQVSEAVSFAVDHEIYGQEIYAAVVLKDSEGSQDNSASLTEADIIKIVSEKVAAFKVPKVIYITDSLPRTATGKIQRRMMADYFKNK